MIYIFYILRIFNSINGGRKGLNLVNSCKLKLGRVGLNLTN